ncbi:uncharacterized protein H6S33_001951 [Morchella sextelata]|uniref:uncharacterized protein n=1 Tax=Morchella sextelata TaxID=1174677 RepID=UPI001D058524|nr:uncharacterized protein H6S33_001951 [Morchella sextelata]KAH0607899.1 hypothetical protein H6S33_001951 [Morchella sextelata]
MHFKKNSSRLSFFSLPRSRRQAAAEKPPTPNPYIPTYAARSFTSSTTPVPLEQRYYARQKKDDATTRETTMTIAERSEAMRQRGRARGQINIELQI